MSLAQILVFIVWPVVGLAMGCAYVVYAELDERERQRELARKRGKRDPWFEGPRWPEEEEPPAVLMVIAITLFAPLVALAGLLLGVDWLLKGGVSRVADRIEGQRRKQDELQARIEELERELEVAL